MGRTKVPASKASASKASASKKDKRKRPHYEPTFYNDQAKKFFDDHLKNREGIRERGITAQYSGIVNIVQRRGWRRFAEQPEAAVLDVVREFYANARMQYKDDIHSRKVLVRGQDVSYDRSTINSFYGLQDYENDEYSAWLEEGPNYDEVIARLTFENSQWKRYNGNPVSFPRGQLKFISRGWHYFISAKLLPSNHVSDVTKDRALLNFAIQSRMTIDVGKIIEASILSCSQGRTTQHLVHPSLIYQLCVAAGVGSIDEDSQLPLPPINDYTMELLEKTSKASRKSKASSPVADTAPSVHEEPITSVGPDSERPTHTTSAPERPTPVTPAPEGTSSSTLHENSLRSIQEQLSDIMKWQYKIMKWQNRLCKNQLRMDKKINYLIKHGIYLQKMMTKANMFEGVTGINIPSLPTETSSSSESEGVKEKERETSDSKAEEEDAGSGNIASDSQDEDGSGSKGEEMDEKGSSSKAEKGDEASSSSEAGKAE